MPTIINPLITEAGLAAAVAANGLGLQLAITHVALGSGQYTPDIGMTSMVTRKEKVTIPSGYVTGGGGFRINALFPAWAGTPNPYNATEVGFYAGDPDAGGVLFAVYSHTSSVIVQRNSLDYVCQFSMVLTRVPAGSVTVTIDAAASQALALVAAHEVGADPHPQYALKSEMAALISAGLAANDYKQSVHVATTANIANLSSGAPTVQDGETLNLYDRILVKDQTTKSQNGFYFVSVLGTGANGTWTRSTDADAAGELTSGAIVSVESGTVNKDSQWMLTTDGVITLGTTELTFENTKPTSVSGLPQNSQSVDYTLVLGDQAKHMLHPTADTATRTFTIPSNASVPYPIGTRLHFVNQAGAGWLRIGINSDTLRQVNTGYTNTFELAANNEAIATKITATEWQIKGVGLQPLPFDFIDTVAVSTQNYDLRAKAVLAGWDQAKRLNAVVTVNSGVIIGSASTGSYGFDTGATFPAGSALALVLIAGAYIVGKGGNGGAGTIYPDNANYGAPGGPALRAQYPISITNNGTIGGGGGGGGPGGNTGGVPGVNGSGGAGNAVGTGQNNGTLTAGGASFAGTYSSGGAGGGLGSVGGSGSAGADVGAGGGPGLAGGAAGAAVNGNSNITWVVTGTRLGGVS